MFHASTSNTSPVQQSPMRHAYFHIFAWIASGFGFETTRA